MGYFNGASESGPPLLRISVGKIHLLHWTNYPDLTSL